LYSDEEQLAIRHAAFRWLDDKLLSGQYEFRRKELQAFVYRETPFSLVDGQKGIWNPVSFSSTVSIVSMLKSKYEDRGREDDGFLSYNYRADGHDNYKLRAALDRRDPLIYFREVHDGSYVANYPVFVAADDPDNQTFLIALDESLQFFGDPLNMTLDERRYAYGISKTRLHQPLFRARVMRAYSSTCAICSLKHLDLLDAAHIVSDSDSQGFAAVTNGLALCKIHHAAYDRNLLGITPDYVVKIDADLLDEVDGPMLRHGIQDMEGRRLVLPKLKNNYPSRESLAMRYDEFVA
jgi:putative restriction endonuclease